MDKKRVIVGFLFAVGVALVCVLGNIWVQVGAVLILALLAQHEMLGALKHGSMFSNGDCFLSPLYRLEAYQKSLSESDSLLQNIQDFIAGDETRGRILWDKLWKDRLTDKNICKILRDVTEKMCVE